METLTSIGIIECNSSNYLLWQHEGRAKGYNLKKVLAKGSYPHQISKRFPQAEIVFSSRDIVNDQSIDLVILAGPESGDLNLVAAALEAGKNVRIL